MFPVGIVEDQPAWAPHLKLGAGQIDQAAANLKRSALCIVTVVDIGLLCWASAVGGDPWPARAAFGAFERSNWLGECRLART
jgi:hypothetical protein